MMCRHHDKLFQHAIARIVFRAVLMGTITRQGVTGLITGMTGEEVKANLFMVMVMGYDSVNQ